MDICIVVPVYRGSQRGNEITAMRWKTMLTELAHSVTIVTIDDPIRESDCLIALNAVKTNPWLHQFHENYPDRSIIVCLTGTDLHGVFGEANKRPTRPLSSDSNQHIGRRSKHRDSKSAPRDRAVDSLDLADRIVLLEPEGQRKLPVSYQAKCQVIFQSARKFQSQPSQQKFCDKDSFLVSLIGHLRKPKDPMLAAKAIRMLPTTSKIKLVHVGEVIEEEYLSWIQNEVEENDRYQWTGKVEHEIAQQILVESQLTLLTSINEGAPSIVSEAVVNEVPMLATRIDATVGMLGEDYPGLFEVGNVEQLVGLMLRAEREKEFLPQLKTALSQKKNRFTRETELKSLEKLINSL